MAREFSDEDIARHLAHEREHGKENYSSYKIIEQLLKERDFHFKNECEADQELINMEIYLRKHNMSPILDGLHTSVRVGSIDESHRHNVMATMVKAMRESGKY